VITIPGGLKAVVYTDVLQTLVLFCGFGFLIHTALRDSGGLAGLRQAVPTDYSSFLGVDSFGVWNVLSLILVLTLNPIADPGRRLTMYSAHTEFGAKWSTAMSGVVVIVFSIAIGITGMYAYRLNPHLKVADEALPWLAMHVLPPWLAALVIVAVVSGMSSAANGCAAAAGTFFVRHIFPLVTGRYPERPIVVVRWALVCAFIFSTALGLYMGSIVPFVRKFLPLTMSGLAVIILLGRFWKRATWQGALAALITTPSVSLALMPLPVIKTTLGDGTIPATVAGLLVHVVVSLLSPPPQHTFEEVAEALSREREAIEGRGLPGAEGTDRHQVTEPVKLAQ
jgi:SSS family solute:Na+ symporter